jgi:hypothetical protein
MQPESKIRHRLKLLRLRYLEKAIRKAISRRPENCLYNNLSDTGSPIPVRLCTNPNPGFCGAVCDETYGGAKIAAKCNQFDSRISAETAKAEFHKFLLEAPTEELAQRYPDIMALLWVLGDHVSRNFDELENELSDHPEVKPTPELLVETLEGILIPEVIESLPLDLSGGNVRLSLFLPEFVYVDYSDVVPINPLVMMYYSNAEAEE